MKKVSKVVKAKPINMGGIEMKQPLPAMALSNLIHFYLFSTELAK